MFKKIQRHRYDEIIKSIHLEKEIQLRHHARMEEKLNLRLDQLEQVTVQVKSSLSSQTGCFNRVRVGHWCNVLQLDKSSIYYILVERKTSEHWNLIAPIFPARSSEMHCPNKFGNHKYI